MTTNSFFVAASTLTLTNTAWALFGQMIFNVDDDFTLAGGLRYTDEEKGLTVQASPIPQAPVNISDEQVSWDFSVD